MTAAEKRRKTLMRRKNHRKVLILRMRAMTASIRDGIQAFGTLGTASREAAEKLAGVTGDRTT